MRRAVIIGGGGIGTALVERFAQAAFDEVHALTRAGSAAPPAHAAAIRPGRIDVADPSSIAAAAAAIGGELDLVVIATGLLHDATHRPERSLAELDAAWLARSFHINAIGPALVLQHFAPLLARDRRTVIAALSARVGNISDNRIGGWYAYRASKAALNMLVRTAAIELARTRRHALCVALHPGTVDTGLSRPFQRGVAADRLFTSERAAQQLATLIDTLPIAASGRCFGWDGQEIQP